MLQEKFGFGGLARFWKLDFFSVFFFFFSVMGLFLRVSKIWPHSHLPVTDIPLVKVPYLLVQEFQMLLFNFLGNDAEIC